jgi:hypothetical protein
MMTRKLTMKKWKNKNRVVYFFVLFPVTNDCLLESKKRVGFHARREPDFDRLDKRERRTEDLRADFREARRAEERRRRVFLPPK